MSLMWIFSVHSSQVCNNLNLCKWKHTHNLLQNQPTIRTNIVIFLPWPAHFAFQSSNMRLVCCENHTDCVLYVRHKQNSRIIAKFVEVLAYLQDTTCWSFSACYWIICMKAIHFLCTWNIRTCFIRWLATSECSKYVQQIVQCFCSKSPNPLAISRSQSVASFKPRTFAIRTTLSADGKQNKRFCYYVINETKGKQSHLPHEYAIYGHPRYFHS